MAKDEDSGDSRDSHRKPAAKKPRAASLQAPDSHDPTRIYLNEIGASPLLSAEEEVYFSRLAQQGDESARKRMIESKC